MTFRKRVYCLRRFKIRRARGETGNFHRTPLNTRLAFLIELKFGTSNDKQNTIYVTKFGVIRFNSMKDMTPLIYPAQEEKDSSCSDVSSRKLCLMLWKSLFITKNIFLNPKFKLFAYFANFKQKEKFSCLKLFVTPP